MTTRASIDLEPLFNPQSLVVVGASSDLTRATGRPLHNLARFGYPGRVYAVNPKHDRIGDVPCYPSVLDLPEAVDLALIAVPAAAVIETVRECIARGVRAAVVNSSGFAEVGETARQAELAAIAREAGFALSGPNCLGFVNFRGPVPGAFLVALDRDRPLVPGPVGLVMQSGALGTFVLAQAQDLGIGLSIFASTGNEAVVEFPDYVDYLIDDPGTRAIGAYVEGLRDGRRLLAVAARALEYRKPIVVLKTGRTRAGSAATASHTALLAGSDRVFTAACRQAGIVQAEGVTELLDFAAVLAEGRFPAGNRIGVLTGSGGGAALLADHGEWLGLQFPPFAPATADGLKQALPPFATVANPIDLTGRIFWEPELLGRCLRLAVADPSLDAVLLYLGTGYRTGDAWVRDLLAIRAETEKPVVVIWTAGPEDAVAALRAAGVYVFDDPVRAIRAVNALVQFGRALAAGFRALHPEGTGFRALHPEGWPGEDARDRPATLMEVDQIVGNSSSIPTLKGGAKLSPTLQGRGGTPIPDYFATLHQGGGKTTANRMVPEIEARRLLMSYGIPIARHALARSSEEAAEMATQLGFPVALKVVSADLPHKTEAGAVRLGVRSAAEAAAAFEEIVRAARTFRPDAALDGILVEEMVDGGTEVIVGAVADPQFGPTVLFGLGGVFAEVLADTSLRVAPVDRDEALAMIREVKGFPLLAGARGRPPTDIDALADVIVRVSQLAVDYSGELAELDLNPLMVLPAGQGVKAVDVLALRVFA